MQHQMSNAVRTRSRTPPPTAIPMRRVREMRIVLPLLAAGMEPSRRVNGGKREAVASGMKQKS